MTDVKSALPLDEEELRQAIELLYFAYRGFTSGPDAILSQMGMGRAHHRVIYFVGRNPGVTVSALLGILRITKQSLARVLSQLVQDGYVSQTPGPKDRRQRLLALTEKGIEFEKQLTARQSHVVARALSVEDRDHVDAFRRILHELVAEGDRRHLPPPPSGRKAEQ
ncbi:MAG TPA: MarR family transcriptional regulator [Magnetospirillaceae bacterium]|jgi:DNA-binding MarR family transcriptional regulator